MIGDLERRLRGLPFETFVDDGDERDLTAYRLSVIGENAHKLSDEIKVPHLELPWRARYAFRNLIGHDYEAISPRFAWAATQELEPIKRMCDAEVARGVTHDQA